MTVQDKTGTISYAGSFIATVVGALTFEDWAVAVGLLLGIATFAGRITGRPHHSSTKAVNNVGRYAKNA